MVLIAFWVQFHLPRQSIPFIIELPLMTMLLIFLFLLILKYFGTSFNSKEPWIEILHFYMESLISCSTGLVIDMNRGKWGHGVIRPYGIWFINSSSNHITFLIIRMSIEMRTTLVKFMDNFILAWYWMKGTITSIWRVLDYQWALDMWIIKYLI